MSNKTARRRSPQQAVAAHARCPCTVKGEEQRRVSVRFPGNKSNIDCFLYQLRRETPAEKAAAERARAATAAAEEELQAAVASADPAQLARAFDAARQYGVSAAVIEQAEAEGEQVVQCGLAITITGHTDEAGYTEYIIR